jgi:hypothetical protein
MFLTVYTVFHTLISLIGIGTGLVVAAGMVKGKGLDGWTGWFLTTTVLTSVTGFFFPVHKFMPSHAVGMISLAVLGVALYALYGVRLEGRWRTAYVVTAITALYLNVFVLVVQLFAKVPVLKGLAPTQTETPFKLAQGVVLVAFVVWGVLAVRGFRAGRSEAEREAVLKIARV